jgi:hypothetical protein
MLRSLLLSVVFSLLFIASAAIQIANCGSVNNAPVAVAGRALDFDGIDDYVMTSLDAQPTAMPTLTWEAWIKPERIYHSDWQGILCTDDGGWDRGIWITAGSNTFSIGCWAQWIPPVIVTTGVWHHIAVVFKSDNVLFYYDGKEYSCGAAPSGGGTIYNQKIGIGNGIDQYYQGAIDEVRIWNTARTQNEIKSNMYRHLIGTETGLAAYYRCDETSGTSLHDATGHGWTGTLNNMDNSDWVVSPIWNNLSMKSNHVLTLDAGYDPDGDSITITTKTAPAHGVLAFNNTGKTIQYTPGTDWTGIDTLRYYITDIAGAADSAEITVTVSPNQPPVAGAGNALSLNGTDTYTEIPFNAGLNPWVFTVSLWAKAEGGQGVFRSAITSRNNDFSGYVIYAGNDDIWQFWTGNGGGWDVLSSGVNVVIGEWVHLSAVYDGEAKYFYVNGQLAGSTTVEANINTVRPLRIGAGATEGGPNYLFNGCIDEVRIWNTALTPGEIAAAMYTPQTGNEASLAGYWRFDEPSGNMAYDATVNGNNGTLINDPARIVSTAWQQRSINENDTLKVSAGYDPDNENLTLHALKSPALGSLSFDNSAVTATYIPYTNRNGLDTFSYVVTDMAGLADTAMVTVTIVPVNDPPVITSAQCDTATEKKPYRYIVTVGEPADETPATITIQNYPGWCMVSGDTLRGVPPPESHGDTSFMIIANDGEFADTLTVQLAIKDSNNYVPVELSSFAAEIKNGSVVLAWTTQSEQNNLGFNILRSANVSGPFTAVNAALIPGAGTTSLPQNYSYTDTDASNGTWYYQLEQLDSQGNKNYSSVVAATVTLTSIANPHLVMATPQLGKQSRILYNTNGVRVLSSAHLNPGIYFTQKGGIWYKVLVTE